MKKLIFTVLALFIFSALSPNALALSSERGSDPTGKSQRQIIERTPWYDPTACVTGSPASTGPSQSTVPNSGGGKIFIIGDSITENSKVQGKVSEALKAKGYDPTFNSKSSRRLSTGGTDLDGISVFEKDVASWKDAGTILVELGTNGAVNKANISKLMDIIKTNNPTAKVYWVNIGANDTGKFITPKTADEYSQIIQDNSSLGYTVIDWNSVAKKNPTYISSDGVGVHPFNDAGSQAYADTISSGLAGFSGTTTIAGSCECQSTGAGGGTGDLSGKDNKQKIWNYLNSKGLTPFQVAGIMGNMQAESGGTFDPRIVEFGFPNSAGVISRPGKPETWDDNVPPDKNKNGQPGYGLVQFTFPTIKQGLRDWAAKNGKKGGDLGIQLDYLWNEMTVGVYKGLYQKMKDTKTIEEASDLFLYQYEKPAERLRAATSIVRKANAKKIFDEFSGTTAPSASTSSGSSSTSSCGATVQSGSTTSVVEVARTELASGPNVGGQKYILGSEKIPWCAAFVSYVLKQAGAPFTGGAGENGYYIPAVASVRSYFENAGTFHPARSGYVPQPGDIAIYKEGKKPFESHVNIVVSVDGLKFTTIGGNESNSIKEKTQENYNADYITGYGTPKGAK